MQTFVSAVLLTIALTAGSAAPAGAETWKEHTGRGSINGREFPIAVVRNAGKEAEFHAALRKRFGNGFTVKKLPGGVLGYGSQFLVTPFADADLMTLPVARDSAALELFVLEHSMTFSLLDINGETLAVGTPLAVLAGTAPGPVPADSEFGYLQHAVKDAVRLSFDFGNAVVTSLAGTLIAPVQDTKVNIRAAFAKDGLLPVLSGEASSVTANTTQHPHELFSDGKSRVRNFMLSNHPESHEVQINVNQVKVR